MKKRVADVIIDTLIKSGIDICFSVVGGGSMHLNNAFALRGKEIKTVYCHHEQACSMAADGYARYSGKIAAVCVTSGPGGINAINGVQGAWVDSIPMIIISGHPRTETTIRATGLKLRCRGVQENDIVSMVAGITKYAKQIVEPKEIRQEIQRAIAVAMEGRRGPVWLDIPLDIQGKSVEEDEFVSFSEKIEEKSISDRDIEMINKVLDGAKRPCILTGSGIRSSGVEDLYRTFIQYYRIPVVGGALRADINSKEDKLYYGMSGAIGPRTGNFIIQNADVILVLGNSLSTTQTGFNQEGFAPNAYIIMVDATLDEMKKPGLHINMQVNCNLDVFFTKMIELCDKQLEAPDDWIEYCDMLRKQLPEFEMLVRHGEFDSEGRVPALLFWKTLLDEIEKDAVITLGNSDSCIGVLQEGIRCSKQRVLVNYNCGSMGNDLPLSIGAAEASGRTVYCITGDGSVMLNIQELETIKYRNYPIKIVIMNNGGYGTIRETCKNYFDGVYAGCNELSGLGFPDFERVANAFYYPYRKCSSVGQINESIRWLIEEPSSCILEVIEMIDDIIGPGISSVMDSNGVFHTPPLHVMTPLLDDDEMKEYMRWNQGV